MKKQKEKNRRIYLLWVKWIALVLVAASVIGIVASGAMTIVFGTVEGLQGTRSEIQEELDKTLLNGYTKILVSQSGLLNGSEYDLDGLDGGNIQYTVTKGTGKNETVLYTNDPSVDEENSIFDCELTSNMSVVGSLADNFTGILFGDQLRTYYTSASDEILIGELAGVFYDESTCLFYAKSGEYYYVIDQFDLVDEHGAYTYYTLETDGDESYYVCQDEIVSDGTLAKNLRLKQKQVKEWQERAAESELYLEFCGSIDTIFPESEAVDATDLQTLQIVDEIPADQISTVQISGVNHSYLSTWDDSEKTYIYTEWKDAAESYHIYASVSDVRQPGLLLENGYGDYFTESEDFCDKILWFRGTSLWFLLLSGAVFLASAIFLVHVAGRRPEDDELHLRFWDRLPLLLVTAVTACSFVCGFVIWELILNSMFRTYGLSLRLAIFGLISTATVVSLIASWYCMSLAVRVKSGQFWHYTLLYLVLRPIRILLRQIKENTALSVKAGALLLGITFAEFLVLESEGSIIGHRTMMFWFFLFKLVEIPVLIHLLYQMNRIREGGQRVAAGDYGHPIDTSHMTWELKKHAENINNVGNGIAIAVEEKIKSERFKTELITNVSHDIKTPLTSIINYVDLLGKEPLDNPTAQEYLEILNHQSARLKKLIEDLIEASKASTGNLPVHPELCDATVMLTQVVGEFKERAEANSLDIVVDSPEPPVNIMADGRHLWRVIDNLMSNICKYALPGTRVYIDLERRDGMVVMTFRNISRDRLNISSDELMARFVRGDSSRNTEGNGLGLSIARSLTELMEGDLEIRIDGDLFKAILRFKEKLD